GSSCVRTGCQTGSSNPSTTSSTTVATPGTPSSLSRGRSCPSPDATGRPSVTHSEDWYKRSLRTERKVQENLDRMGITSLGCRMNEYHQVRPPAATDDLYVNQGASF